MACTCVALTARCPHCGRIAAPEGKHRDECHDAAERGEDTGFYWLDRTGRIGILPPR
jgi:uncharacterized OB-fold protein